MSLSSHSPRHGATLLLLCCLAWLAPALAYHEAEEPSDGTIASFKPLPAPLPLPAELEVVDAAGQRVPLAAFRGRVLLLNLWATWCPPCVRELPALDRLQGRLGGDGFVVLAVSLDAGGTAEAAPFYARLGIRHLGLYADPARALGTVLPDDVLPASFFVDRDGNVVSFLRSYVDWDDPRVDAHVGELTGQP
ncbi:MAG TPA: TlpA disulfide reductase family protein [Gammaproteobacteria bacterium]